jgi:hypothetical protein
MDHSPSPPPAAAIMDMAAGLWLSRAIWLAAHFGIADLIQDDPVPVKSLAQASGVREDMLRRVLLALSAHAVFRRGTGDRFGHTNLSNVLRSDHPQSQRAFVDSVFGGEHFQAWAAIDRTLREGRTAFEAQWGMRAFDWYAANPERRDLFAKAMTGITLSTEAPVLAAHIFSPFSLAVDIGGSAGSLLRGLLARHPQAQGILFDLPGTIDAMKDNLARQAEGARIAPIGGDFFESVPEGGDLYLLKFILHDWNDDQCLTILANVRRAIRSGGRIAVLEMVLPDDGSPHPGWLMDLNMMAMTGGRERTASQYRHLLEAARFEVSRITPTQSPMSVVEAIVAN